MRIPAIYREFPQRFWTVVLVAFIDKIGGTLVFPFFALYITQKFHVGMTQAGLVLGILSFFGMLSGMLGGALTDRFGRRPLILSGLVFSALSSLGFGFVDDFVTLYVLAAIVGLLSEIGAPAHAAMIADILPAHQRQEGFGILRVAGNLAWLVGPTIGGFVARTSFLALFVMDAAVSCAVALLFYVWMPETKPERQDGTPDESALDAFMNYRVVSRDLPFLAFLVAVIVMGVVYIQMYHSLSVFLRNSHGTSPQGFGFLLTASAIVVILCQFRLLRALKGRPPFLMMAVGTLFYALGFVMFGFVSAYWLFVTAIVIITIGEMIAIPTSQAIAACFAPTDMRGRYMAVFGLSGSLPGMIGPAAAGVILDNYNPNLLWYLGAALCLAAALGFALLQRTMGRQPRFAEAGHQSRQALV